MRLLPALLLTVPFAAHADAPRVVTDIPPVHSLVSIVMEGVGTPALLLPGNVSPHDASLKSSDARALQEAQLVVAIGPQLTPWLEDAAEKLALDAAHLDLLDLAAVKLEVAEGGHHHGHGAADDDHDDHEEHGDHEKEAGLDDHDDHDDHAEKEDHADHDDHSDHDDHAEKEEHADHDDHAGHDDHGGEALDPHAWLNIRNAVAWLPVIADALQQIDPDNAATYGANVQAAVSELTDLDAQISAQLAPFADVSHLVYHDAYAYFRNSYPLNYVGSLASNEGAAPSVADMRNAEALIADGATCVLSEVHFSDKLISQLASKEEVRVMQLDPLGAAFEPGPELYAQTLGGMAETYAACLAE